jgi:hypothetical protein
MTFLLDMQCLWALFAMLVGPFAMIVSQEPCLFAIIVGREILLFASLSPTVCKPLHLTSKGQEHRDVHYIGAIRVLIKVARLPSMNKLFSAHV